jgi:hypothetical protein
MFKGLLADLLRARRGPDRRPFYDAEDLGRRLTEKSQQLRAEGYLDYPALVHLETRAVCNAACSFCPYERLERKGTAMPDALIEKVIDDLTAIPQSQSFQVAPYKVSDPLLEPRLFDILARVNERLPNASVSIITNGSAFTDAKVDGLARVERLSYISVSLNFVDPAEYEQVMKLPLVHTLHSVRLLERAVHAGRIRCPVRVTRVSQGASSDRKFRAWVKENFPAFMPAILPRNDWIGQVESAEPGSIVPDVPCHRWFDLSITASGVVAMCCMDGEARYPKGDIRHQHALDIYNQPFLRELRRTLPTRRTTGGPCDQCTYLSF